VVVTGSNPVVPTISNFQTDKEKPRARRAMARGSFLIADLFTKGEKQVLIILALCN